MKKHSWKQVKVLTHIVINSHIGLLILFYFLFHIFVTIVYIYISITLYHYYIIAVNLMDRYYGKLANATCSQIREPIFLCISLFFVFCYYYNY
jgi:hypothetical protein